MTAPHPRAWERTVLITGLWFLQFAAFYAAPALYLAANENGDFLSDLANSDYALFGLVIATFLASIQGAFLLPIRARSHRADQGPSPLRLFAVAACLACVVGGVVAYIFIELIANNFLSLHEQAAYTAFWATSAGLCLPVFLWLLRRFRTRLPVIVSMAMAALLAGTVTSGLVLAVVAVVRLISDVDTPRAVWYWLLIPSPLVGWAIFTPLIIAFVRKGPPEAQLSRLAARLLLGTTIEAVAVIPVQIMIRRRTSCYCDEASFWSLVASLSVGLVTLGPAVYLLVWKRYHLRTAEGRCRACGYDMTGTPQADRCPECGAGWKLSGTEN